ncbi:MAG: HIT domain-containing protein [Anaerolineales bacterium]|nr:HIT domain-containing protein [Anaerolineales bacterium]
MEHLWSPWRMAYLRNADPAAGPAGPTGCIFCDLPAQDRDAENLIVHRGALAYVLLNRYPYNNGHLLIVPYAHVSSFEALDPPTLTEIMTLANTATATLRRIYNPQAFNLGANIGAAAGAGIAEHVHLHLVPRWAGDTNFMSTTSGTRVIPEDLAETYRLARQHWPGGASA